MSTSLPTNPSESTKRRNPTFYRPCPPDRDDMAWMEDEQVCQDASKRRAKAHPSHPVPEKVSEHPKSPEDRLNKTEREFLVCLRNGQYGTKNYIGIQSMTLQLGFDTRYTPDFWTHSVVDGETFMTFWEIKGFMRDDARVKLYAAARMFPFWTFILVHKTSNGFKTKVIDQ